jgi:GH25 family lysozyme M1 (1,4-beta-N-acetylmuramidase)
MRPALKGVGMKKIIDISYHQEPTRIDYDRLLSQVDGVIIRLGYGTGASYWQNQPDPAFERNYAEAHSRGIPVGCYHYMVEYKTVNAQLDIVKSAMAGKQFELGFWPDVELEAKAPPLTRKTVIEYVDKIEAHLGHEVGIYTGAWCWNPIMGTDNPYSSRKLWVASYSSSPYMPNGWDEWVIWQYSSTGRLDGYYGNLDMNSISDENWKLLVGDEPPAVNEPLFKAKVLAKALNVRSEPVYYPDNRNVVDQLSMGDIVDVYAVNDANGWYRIGINRWCSGNERYVDKIPHEQPSAPVEVPSDALERLWVAHPELHD